jgi:hypothetical protein
MKKNAAKKDTHSPPAPLAQEPIAKIVKLALVPKHDPNDPDSPKPTPQERALAGRYRVIHGNLSIPNPDKATNANAPAFIYAKPGDEVELGDVDAANMLDADVVEETDAKPSRVGKVWQPQKPATNMRASAKRGAVG